MSPASLPGRGVAYMRPAETPEGPGLEIGCDCGTVTVTYLEIPGTEAAPDMRELAVTCNGCGTSHWLTLVPTGTDPQESAP